MIARQLIGRRLIGPTQIEGPPPEPAAGEASAPAVQPSKHRAARARWASVRVPVWLAFWRIVIGVVFAHLVIVLLPQSRQHLPGGALNAGSWWGAFDRWDSAYYTGIAAHAYPTQSPSLTAFFPGYPLVVRALHFTALGALTYLQAAMLVSWMAFLAAAVLLYRLVESHFSTRSALVATAAFCWFPTSLFFLAPYGEALFALEVLAVAALVDRCRYLLASLVAAFASATSPETVALTAAIVVAALIGRRGIVRAAGYALVSGIGIVAFALYLWIRFGRPLLFVSVEKDWHRSENLPFVGLYRNVVAIGQYLRGPGPAPGGPNVTFANIKWVWILDDAMLVLAAVAVGYLLLAKLTTWRRSGREPVAAGVGRRAIDRSLQRVAGVGERLPSHWLVIGGVIVLLGACTTIFPYGSSHFSSTEGEARFVSVAFPVFVGLALLVRRRAALTLAVVSTFAAAALLFQGLYNLGYWMT